MFVAYFMSPLSLAAKSRIFSEITYTYIFTLLHKFYNYLQARNHNAIALKKPFLWQKKNAAAIFKQPAYPFLSLARTLYNSSPLLFCFPSIPLYCIFCQVSLSGMITQNMFLSTFRLLQPYIVTALF